MKEIIKRRENLKKAMRGRNKVYGAWTSIGHPSITEIFCNMPIGFLGIDIEHSTISQEQSQRIIAASHSAGRCCLPRIASHNMEMIKRLLDSGADGVIVPMVNNKSELEKVVSWCKYPPAGKRSFGVARAQNYGFDFGEYAASWNKTGVLIPQIESIEAVDNIESILDNDAVDGVMVGPYDMSGSLNIPGELDSPKVRNACRKVIDACKRSGKSCGTQLTDPDLSGIKKAFKDGYTFIVLASDVFLLWKWSEKMSGLIKNA